MIEEVVQTMTGVTVVNIMLSLCAVKDIPEIIIIIKSSLIFASHNWEILHSHIASLAKYLLRSSWRNGWHPCFMQWPISFLFHWSELDVFFHSPCPPHR